MNNWWERERDYLIDYIKTCEAPYINADISGAVYSTITQMGFDFERTRERNLDLTEENARLKHLVILANNIIKEIKNPNTQVYGIGFFNMIPEIVRIYITMYEERLYKGN